MQKTRDQGEGEEAPTSTQQEIGPVSNPYNNQPFNGNTAPIPSHQGIYPVTNPYNNQPFDGNSAPIPSRQGIYPVTNSYNNQRFDGNAGNSVTIGFVKLPVKSASTVKWLSVVLVICGLVMMGAQVAPTSWYAKLYSFDSLSDISVGLRYNVSDNYGTGFWCGLLTSVAGMMGLIAPQNNNKQWILSHLIVKIAASAAAIAMIAFAGNTLSGIALCKTHGSKVLKYNKSFYYGPDTTTPQPAVYTNIFGEIFFTDERGEIQDKYFYCFSDIFTIWIVLEALMIVSALVALLANLWLHVKNWKALFPCLQECDNCCLKSCTQGNNSEDADGILMNN